jgi:hypothetical protein
VFCVMVKLDLFCFVVCVLRNLLDLFVNLWFRLAPLFCLQEPKVSFSCDFICFFIVKFMSFARLLYKLRITL